MLEIIARSNPLPAASHLRLLPFLQESDHLGRIVVVSLLQLSGLLRRQLFSIGIQHNQDGKSELRRVAIFFHHVGVVPLVLIGIPNAS